MAAPNPQTYEMALVELSSDTAEFRIDGQTHLSLPAEEWVRLGRPGTLQVTPLPIQGRWS